ncbi:MAG: T9SS type A sorting domain-containing protein [Candidatus Latescibacteria bacterium]|nr:T9SS type A sorting domain-containing protein [bacterium]MBD3424502.1 T9SS type A sorting domain-containing protein [Candidatus Latescibacterota bacterium]
MSLARCRGNGRCNYIPRYLTGNVFLMSYKCNNNNIIMAALPFFMIILLIPGPPGILGKSLSYSFGNGIKARIYTPDTIKEEMLRRTPGGNLILEVARGWEYELIEDPSDPAIAYSGDGNFHPHRSMYILEALEEVDVNGNILDIEIKVYLLPFPRRGIVNSTASGYRIFLCPAVLEPEGSTSKCIVTHELGHCVQRRYLPVSRISDWRVYLSMRGFPSREEIDFGCSSHRDDPLEIFAEDFRYLFGGEDSLYPEGVENGSLRSPDEVAGLEDFFCSLVSGSPFSPVEGGPTLPVAVSNYPNPFNPATTVRVNLSEETVSRNPRLNISVYDANGRLVNEIFDRRVGSRTITAGWNGRDRSGASVSSGVYMYVVRAGNLRTTGKMLLLR